MPADNTAHLITAARRRHELTRARAIRALRELDQAGEHITFEIVARKAGISRSWLYSQPGIRDQLQQLRDTTRRTSPPRVPASQRTSDASFLHRLQAANERNRQLAKENQRLRRQLAEALGQLRASGKSSPFGNDRTTLTKP